MAVLCGRILTTNALLRIVALALAIADVLLARFAGEGSGPIQLWTNEKWLVIIASGGYVIVLSAIVGCYFRGQPIPLFLEYLFICLGAALFLAAGATTMSAYSNYRSYNKTGGLLALAICLFGTGVTMAVDFGLMIFNCRG